MNRDPISPVDLNDVFAVCAVMNRQSKLSLRLLINILYMCRVTFKVTTIALYGIVTIAIIDLYEKS